METGTWGTGGGVVPPQTIPGPPGALGAPSLGSGSTLIGLWEPIETDLEASEGFPDPLEPIFGPKSLPTWP